MTVFMPYWNMQQESISLDIEITVLLSSCDQCLVEEINWQQENIFLSLLFVFEVNLLSCYQYSTIQYSTVLLVTRMGLT